MNKLYNVGIYLRLSRENTAYLGADSMSLENQQAMLSKFIGMMPGWVEKRTYIDNGASGGNFNREGFQDMMTDVRSGLINLVLVQDLSRFGRNYLETGKYLEEELPALGCRFVALSDGIDTEDGENDIMPFLNAMNDYYLKNLSDRIKSVLTAKAKDGQKLSGAVPYGYDRSPQERTRLIVDEFAADVVSRMFKMRAEGMGYAAIAGVLNREGLLPPRMYYFQRQSRETKFDCTSIWSSVTVKKVLENELYLGHTVAFKRKTRSYRDERPVMRDESEWIRTENTHTPIVDEDTWRKVQERNLAAKVKVANHRLPQPSLFSGLLVCPDCNANMSFNANKRHYVNGEAVRYGSYYCRTYSSSGRTVCSWHRISEPALKNLVFSHIKEQADRLALDEAGMLQSLRERLLGEHSVEKRDAAKERRTLEARLHTLEMQAEQLYEDKVSGLVSAETFATMAARVETERMEVSERLSELTQAAEFAETKLADIDRWARLIKEKSTLKEVDRDLLESLVEKIEVGEKTVVDGVMTQDVKIFYMYVGLC